MSAQALTNQTSQQNTTEKMGAATQKSLGESMQATPAFSYAQAAKGKAPTVPSQSSASKSQSDTTEIGAKRYSTSEITSEPNESNKSTGKRTASEGRAPQSADFKTSVDQRSPRSDETESNEKPVALSAQIEVAGLLRSNVSTPSSPGHGTTSTSTLPKEEDVYAAAEVNGSSESTWDKQSRESQNGTGNGEKLNAEKERASTAAWDEETPAPTGFKEAPPPPVNVWQQRMAQYTKPKPRLLAPAQPLKAADSSSGMGIATSQVKNIESTPEPRRQEGRKKSKSGPEDRAGPRDGTKPADGKQDKGSVMPSAPPLPPPSLGDAISYPSLDSAVGEEKKKTQEAVEKEDKEKPQPAKSQGKKEWVTVPFTPTAVFNTPLPQARRGGHASRAPREGGPRGRNAAIPSNNNNGVDKSASSNPAMAPGQVFTDATERAKAASAATNTSKPKRASSAGPTSVKEQRQPADYASSEKRKDGDLMSAKPNQSKGSNNNDPRWQSALASANTTVGVPSNNAPRNETSQFANNLRTSNGGEKQHQQNGPDEDMHPRNSVYQRRSEGSIRPLEQIRDIHGNLPARERTEGRADRGRGGFRGRGGPPHALYNSNIQNGHTYSNGPSSQYQHSSTPLAKQYSNHDRMPSHPQGVSFPAPQQQNRQFRSGSRSQSIPHSPYGRFSNGPHGGPPNLPSIQTELAQQYGIQPGHQGIMSAVPYDPYTQMNLSSMVALQMEYYFSIDNLCKDMYLRQHMDSQGFVPLNILAKFNRIKQLTTEREIIRYVCLSSPSIEFRLGKDGKDLVRRRDGWETWILKMDQRDPSAQHDGLPPALIQNPNGDIAHTYNDQQGHSPRSIAPRPLENAQHQSLNGSYSGFASPPSHTGLPVQLITNGAYSSISQTPLSAAVPDFLPPSRQSNERNTSTANSNAQGMKHFTDEEVDRLNIGVRHPSNLAASALPPFHSSNSRTFSNGSIDGRTIQEELSRSAEPQSRPPVNGEASESVDQHKPYRSKSPFLFKSPSRHATTINEPSVFWIKDAKNDVPLQNLPSDLWGQSYQVLRQEGLKAREQVAGDDCPYNLRCLYEFWAHFLIRNFNARMYQEFRNLALEDASQRDWMTGMRSLIKYYDELLLGNKTVADDFADFVQDFVDLVKMENSKADRPAFNKLRAAWRNGAFDLKNRRKISKLIDENLKAELE